jgi:uncharacterized protein DUF2752
MKYFAQVAWVLALGFLYFMDVESTSASLCVFKSVGFNSCPGCGIGHAIHHALHFDLVQSIKEHILGIPATLGILYMIIEPFISLKKSNNNGSKRHVLDLTGNSSR